MILFGLVLGLTGRLVTDGVAGIPIYLVNIVLPVFLLFLLYRFRALGAGDIKLFSMLGGFLQTRDLLMVILYSFFFGAAIGLPKLIKTRQHNSKIHFSIAIYFAFTLQMGVKLCMT